MTHAYYVGILTSYVPAIYHGQDSGGGGRYGLGLKPHVQKVTKQTPRRIGTTLCIIQNPSPRIHVLGCAMHRAVGW